MATTLEQQTRAIRIAIKGLETELVQLARKGESPESRVIADVNDEIAALADAIVALRTAAEFRASLKSFIAG